MELELHNKQMMHFELLTNPRSADTPYQTPELFVEGIKFGQLQGKDLKNFYLLLEKRWVKLLRLITTKLVIGN